MAIREKAPHTEAEIPPLFDLTPDQIKKIPAREFDRDSLPKDPSDINTDDRESFLRAIELGLREFGDETAIFQEMVVQVPDEKLLAVALLIEKLNESVLSNTDTWEALDEEQGVPKPLDFYRGWTYVVPSEDGQKVSVPIADRASLLTYLQSTTVSDMVLEAYDNESDGLNLPDDWDFVDIQLDPEPKSKIGTLAPFYLPLTGSALFELLHSKRTSKLTDPIEVLKSVIKEAPVDQLVPIALSLQEICAHSDTNGDSYIVIQEPSRTAMHIDYQVESGIITFDIAIGEIRSQLLLALKNERGPISHDALWEEFELWMEQQAPRQ